MIKKEISGGVVHRLPDDVRKILISQSDTRYMWEDITPLARNEWICWITSAKKIETRNSRIERMSIELKRGKRRPCCWAGCVHR